MADEKSFTIYTVRCAETDGLLFVGITENMPMATRRIYAKIPSDMCRIEVISTAQTYRAACELRKELRGEKRRRCRGEAIRVAGPIELRFD